MALGVGLAVFALVDGTQAPDSSVDSGTRPGLTSEPTVLGAVVTRTPAPPAEPATVDIPGDDADTSGTVTSRRTGTTASGSRPTTTTETPGPTLIPPTVVDNTTTTSAPTTTEPTTTTAG